jgi:hypothetical protein
LSHAVTTDIDIDFADRDKALEGLMHIAASMKATDVGLDDAGDKNKRHPSGVYFQDVPTDPFTGFCSIPYKDAAELGYFKIDFLNNTLYKGVRDEDHLDELVNREPDWLMLQHREIVKMLVHIGEHFGTVQSIQPQSVEDLAVVLALMRPGKRHLVGRPRHEIDAEIWKAEGDRFVFKRAHALAYAVSIVVQMNLICEQTAALMEEE